MSMILCECGCGHEPKPGNRFIHGHNHRGKSHSEQWVENQSVGVRSAWKDPDKFTANRHQTAERRARTGASVKAAIASWSAEKKAALAAKIAKANTGRKLSAAHKAKVIKYMLRYEQLSEEAKRRKNAAISKARTGTHGSGRSARDRPDHFRALHWIVRDSRGVLHEFDNLQSWSRANEWRFLPDKRPASKLPLWKRAVGGFNGMQRLDGKGLHQWNGWTLVSVKELEIKGAPDPLNRKDI